MPTASCLKELVQQGIATNTAAEKSKLYRAGNCYFIGSANDFNARLARAKFRLFDF